MTLKFTKAQFLTSASSMKGLPNPKDQNGNIVPEIAIVGRSNVGKSTLLQGIFNNKKIVKTSSTPGKTQLINIFNIEDKVRIADLPGYGYAKVPEKIKRDWGALIHNYLNKRDSLKILLLLLDIRRIPNDSDKQLLDWACAAQKPTLLVITKTDKLSRQAAQNSKQKILTSLNEYDNLHYVLYSAKQKGTILPLIKEINNALKSEL